MELVWCLPVFESCYIAEMWLQELRFPQNLSLYGGSQIPNVYNKKSIKTWARAIAISRMQTFFNFAPPNENHLEEEAASPK
jgi:hypothetical protein